MCYITKPVSKQGGNILHCELSELHSSSDQFLQFTKQDVAPHTRGATGIIEKTFANYSDL